jgi:hypothetical protein
MSDCSGTPCPHGCDEECSLTTEEHRHCPGCAEIAQLRAQLAYVWAERDGWKRMFWFAVWLDRYLEGPCRQCGTDLPDAPRGGQP